MNTRSRIVRLAAVFATAVLLSAQSLTVVDVPLYDSASVMVSYAKYLKAKDAYRKEALRVADKLGIACPVFSTDFTHVVNDPECDQVVNHSEHNEVPADYATSGNPLSWTVDIGKWQ